MGNGEERVGVERIVDCQVLRSPLRHSGVDTLEGEFVPLLSGDAIRTHLIHMGPYEFSPAHPHSSESLIYTIRGKWVFCTTEAGEEKRVLVNPGDLLHFPAEVDTGFEVPFDETATILIFKGQGGTYDEMMSAFVEAREVIANEVRNGTPASFADLPPDHPAIAFGEMVSGANPLQAVTVRAETQ